MSRIPIAAPDVGADEQAAVREVLESGMLADGEEVRRFEEEFASYCGAAHGVATANGTVALHTALAAAGVGEGDRVLTTPFSFVATANAVRHAGARPAFVDVDPETYNLDPERLERRLRSGERVDAVVVVHLYGLPAEMERFVELAEEYDFALVEDAAQAHGAAVRGRPVGALGDVGCFSFYPTKNMTTAEGGMVVTDDEEIRDRAATLVDHGRSASYRHEVVGYNYRMTNVAAAIGRVQLDRLPSFVEARRRNARALTEALADAPVATPTVPDGRRHAYHQYTVRAEDRDGLQAHLHRRDVDAAVYYPIPIHRQPAYDEFDATLPNAERAAERVLSLPVHPGVSSDDVERIADAVREYATDETVGRRD